MARDRYPCMCTNHFNIDVYGRRFTAERTYVYMAVFVADVKSNPASVVSLLN